MASFSRIRTAITSSCWIVDPERGRVLLTWHKRLNHWLQMGGHVEVEDATLLDSALREAREEARRDGDVQAHSCEPEWGEYPDRKSPARPAVHAPVRREVAWVDLGKVVERNPDASMRRMGGENRISLIPLALRQEFALYWLL